TGLLDASGGPLLFGGFSIADAFYAPICMRLFTYALPVPAAVRAYMERVRAFPGVAGWIEAALAEPDFLDFEEPYQPWRIRVNEALRRRLVEDAPSGYLAMIDATKRLGVTRQTVLQRVKRGELDAVLVCYGRRKGLRIKVLDEQPGLFDPTS